MNYLPVWTERAEKRGLDPLGMQNSSVQLYQSLLPGVSNVTLRVRYYGLYCWASEAFARHRHTTDLEKWIEWIRRLEALYALVAEHRGGESGVAGVQWAAEILAADADPINFEEGASTNSEARRYLKQRVGVFGQAYLSQMEELQLFDTIGAENHTLPLRTVEAGLPLARAFAAAIGSDVEALLIRCLDTPVVTRAELEQLALALPANISVGAERDQYENLLFARSAEPRIPDASRRDTLLLVLHVSKLLGRRPRSDDVRQHLFEGFSELPASLAPQRLRWEAYQVQDMWQIAAAALLSWAIDMTNDFVDGRSVSEIHAEVTGQVRRLWPGRMNLDWDGLVASSAMEDAELDENVRTIAGKRESRDTKAAIAIEVMAALAKRLNTRTDLQAEVDRSFSLQSGGRSVRTETLWLARQNEGDLATVLADYVAQRVVSRHNQIAIQKLRRQGDYTFLFEARDGRLVYRAQYEPVPTTPRLDPAIQFLVDIDLIGETGLTDRGRDLLEAFK